MLIRITRVELRGGYRLYLQFSDSAEGEVDLSGLMKFDGVFAAFEDQSFFQQVEVDENWGCLRWPNALDLAPEPLYEHITGRNPLA